MSGAVFGSWTSSQGPKKNQRRLLFGVGVGTGVAVGGGVGVTSGVGSSSAISSSSSSRPDADAAGRLWPGLGVGEAVPAGSGAVSGFGAPREPGFPGGADGAGDLDSSFSSELRNGLRTGRGAGTGVGLALGDGLGTTSICCRLFKKGSRSRSFSSFDWPGERIASVPKNRPRQTRSSRAALG
jgi:hypothetical protein